MSRARRLPLPPHGLAPTPGGVDWRVVWEVDFTGPSRPVGAYTTLPGDLIFERDSAADYATSGTTTDTAAADAACLYQPTDSPWSRGLLVRPPSGGRAAEHLWRAAHADLLSPAGRLVLELCVHHATAPGGTPLLQLGEDSANCVTVSSGGGEATLDVALGGVHAVGTATGVPDLADATVVYRIGMGGGGPLEAALWVASRAVVAPDDATATWYRYDVVGSSDATGPLAPDTPALYLLGDDGNAQLDAALRWARALVAADEVEGAVAPARRLWQWGQVAQPAALTYVRTGTWQLVTTTDPDSYVATATTEYGASAWGTQRLFWGEGAGTNGVTPGDRYCPVLPGHTNLLSNARDITGGAWGTTAGTTRTADAYASPDGTTSGDRAQTTSANVGTYQRNSSTAGSTTYCWSLWLRAGGVAGAYQVLVSDDVSVNSFAASIDPAPAAFALKRGSLTTSPGSTSIVVVPTDGRDLSVSGGIAAGTRDCGVDLFQLHAGTYHRPWASGTVGPTLLTVAAADFFGATTGRFDVDLATHVVAYETYSSTTTDRYLLYLDANNHLRWDHTTLKFVLVLGGAIRASSTASTHAADDDLGASRVWSRGDGCGFTINGETCTGAAVAALTEPATVAIGSDGASAATVFPMRLFGRWYARRAGV